MSVQSEVVIRKQFLQPTLFFLLFYDYDVGVLVMPIFMCMLFIFVIIDSDENI